MMLQEIAKRSLERSAERNRKNILALIKLNISGGVRFLDIGCDDGEFSVAMARAVGTTNLYGVEIVASQAAIARERGIIINEANLEKALPYDDRFFELVVANQVIEHIHNIELFISEIKRILRPGGFAIISTENLASWHNICALVFGWQPFSSANFLPGRSLGNPFSLHKARVDEMPPESWCHDKVLAYRALKDMFSEFEFKIIKIIGSGYYPLPAFLGEIDVRHSHWITFSLQKKNS